MIITNFKSNTNEWLAHRRQRNNASEAPIMMSVSPYATRNELLHQKTTGLDKEFSAWFQKNILDNGHVVEASARPIAEEIVGEELYPISATDDEGWLAASFDGQTLLNDKNWECKQWNEAKAADVRAGRVPDSDYWQLVHQFAVNPGSETLYMVTDGTKEKTVHMWVKPNHDDIKRLKAGWAQFDEDRKTYKHAEYEAAPEGKAPDALPALSVQVTGMVTASNLKAFEESARATLAAINTDLQTDQDFADAEQAVKFCKEVEKRLDGAKENVLGQMQTVDEVVRSIDAIKEETRQIRLKLNKAVTEQKEARKLEILQTAKQDFDTFLRGVDVGQYMPPMMPDFAGAMKGKRTISSLQSACDDLTAQSKIEANELAAIIRGNLTYAKEEAADYKFLFSDIRQICDKPADDFIAVVKSRIADHKEAEQKRLDAEREKIRQEEEARARQAAEEDARLAVEAEARSHKAAASASQPRPEPAPTEKVAAPEETITISRAEYDRLVENSRLYLALAAAGVDSWEGYDIAVEIMESAA